jgi:hypothetical protein
MKILQYRGVVTSPVPLLPVGQGKEMLVPSSLLNIPPVLMGGTGCSLLEGHTPQFPVTVLVVEGVIQPPVDPVSIQNLLPGTLT